MCLARFRAGFRAGFRVGFYAKLELFRASRRFPLLQTLCTRRYEKRTQQAELVGKNYHHRAFQKIEIFHSRMVVVRQKGWGARCLLRKAIDVLI